MAREIRKRLITIAQARSFIDWQKRKAFVADLETQRRAIIDHVAKTDPAEAVELLWRLLFGPMPTGPAETTTACATESRKSAEATSTAAHFGVTRQQ